MDEKLRQIRKELFGIDTPVQKTREVVRQGTLKDLGREKPSSPSKRRKLKNYLDEDNLGMGLDEAKEKSYNIVHNVINQLIKGEGMNSDNLDVHVVEIDGIKWKYKLSKKIIKSGIIYYIDFIYPSRLQWSTKYEDTWNSMQSEVKIKEILNLALKKKHKSKLTDSFNTKFKMFVFDKFMRLSNQEFDQYFSEKIVFDKIMKNFDDFILNEDKADVFSSQYYQKDPTEEIYYLGYKKTVSEIINKLNTYYDDLKDDKKEYLSRPYVFNLTDDNYRKKVDKENKKLYEQLRDEYIKNDGKKKFTEDFFYELQSKELCEYCGISLEQIRLLGKNKSLHNKRSETRGYALEIDRKHPNLEYTDENCCMACYWCNNAKTDEFCVQEFKEIAKSINIVWNKRLKDIDVNENVVFPKDSSIWNSKKENINE